MSGAPTLSSAVASSGAQPSPATPSPLTPPSDSYSQTQSELNTLKRRLLSLAVADTDGSGGLGASAASQGVALAGDAADALRLQIAQLTQDRARLESELQHTSQLYDQEKRLHTSASQAAATLRKRADDLERLLTEKQNELLATQRDLQIMGEKLVDEIERRAELQHSKEAVQDELEQLTSQLFEEANVMVAKEAQKSFQMEKTTKMLEEELAQTRLRLEAESTQLRELRKKMTEFVAEREAQDEVLGEAIAGGNVASLAATLGRAEPGSRNSFIAGGGDDPRKSIDSRTDDEDDQLDQTMFAEFLEFVAQLSGYKLAQVGKLPFMKTAVEDDIEPVLRFGGNPQVSSKKIIDSIIENRILVQEVTANSPILNPPSPAPKFSQSEPNLGSTASAYAAAAAAAAAANKTPLAREKSVWERFSGLPGVGPPNVCQACGNTTPNAAPCRFQFRLSEADPWSALCGTCRDRLVSACDFYNFVRHVKTGLMANRPNMELYKEALRLKRQMFYARCGAMHLAQQERGFGRFRLRTLGRPSTPETGRSDEPPTLRRAPTAPSPLNPSALAMAQQQAAPPPLSQSAPANPAGGDMPQLAMPPLNKRT